VAEGAIKKLATVTGIDATSTGTTLLYNVPVGKKFIPAFVVIRVISFTAGAKSNTSRCQLWRQCVDLR